jgi:hypothetical protein
MQAMQKRRAKPPSAEKPRHTISRLSKDQVSTPCLLHIISPSKLRSPLTQSKRISCKLVTLLPRPLISPQFPRFPLNQHDGSATSEDAPPPTSSRTGSRCALTVAAAGHCFPVGRLERRHPLPLGATYGVHVYMCATVGPRLGFLFLTVCFGLVYFFSVILVCSLVYCVGVWGILVTNATISPPWVRGG